MNITIETRRILVMSRNIEQRTLAMTLIIGCPLSGDHPEGCAFNYIRKSHISIRDGWADKASIEEVNLVLSAHNRCPRWTKWLRLDEVQGGTE